MSRAFVFPGQGSQFVGMGRDLHDTFPEARDVFEEIDESLQQNLSTLIFNGPEGDLNLTENTQPALMAVSMAVVEVLKKQGGIELAEAGSYVAGHSLGEYSALTAAGTLELARTAGLLKLRGQAMQKAVPEGQGMMAAILGLSLDDVQAIVKEAAGTDICQAANDNSVGQVVVSGHKAAVENAVALAGERGAKKAVTLPVSAPFHCTLMAPAAQTMAQALADVDMRPPALPVVCNVTAIGETDPHQIRRLLVDQVTSMVRWRESVIWMKDQGVDTLIELGAGKVLCGLAKRIDRSLVTQNIGTPAEIENLIETLG